MFGAGHLKQRRTSRVRGIVLGLSLASATGEGVPFATGAQIPPPPVETAPAFQPPVLLPSLGDFVTGKPLATCCKLMATDCLSPPFAGAPVTDPKGLASKIRAKELDAKNRIIALQYLGTVDCVKFPEAKTMLVEELHNDPFEPVRYQAALSLGVMMGRGNTRRDMRTLRRGRAVRYDTCIGCCNEKVLKALAKTAYEMDDHGCCFEPSKRVREAAWRRSTPVGARTFACNTRNSRRCPYHKVSRRPLRLRPSNPLLPSQKRLRRRVRWK